MPLVIRLVIVLIVDVAIVYGVRFRLDVVTNCAVNEESVLRSAYLIAEQIPYTNLSVCVHLDSAINIATSVVQH